jgi:RNA recognition motif-containing protein
VRRSKKEVVITRKVFAGNLSFDITKEQLLEAFGAIGPVQDVFMPLDKMTGRMRGFAFVEYEAEGDAAKAIETLDGTELAGRPLRVNEAQAKPQRSFSAPRDGGWAPPFDGGKPFKNKGSRRGIRRRKRGF